VMKSPIALVFVRPTSYMTTHCSALRSYRYAPYSSYSTPYSVVITITASMFVYGWMDGFMTAIASRFRVSEINKWW
jgi:hypothetical protein